MIKSGLSIGDQVQIDELLKKLDGTDNKSKLGANSILAASMVFTKASAVEKVLGCYNSYFNYCRMSNYIKGFKNSVVQTNLLYRSHSSMLLTVVLIQVTVSHSRNLWLPPFGPDPLRKL